MTAIIQIVVVAISGSIALLADTLHNVGHAATTIPLIVAFRMGQRSATSRYPYGDRRAEDLVGLLVSVVIALSAALIIWESVHALINPVSSPTCGGSSRPVWSGWRATNWSPCTASGLVAGSGQRR
ncbi:MAG: cation diffusion facilitator family transporter [Ornithinimicrobium sp.]